MVGYELGVARGEGRSIYPTNGLRDCSLSLFARAIVIG